MSASSGHANVELTVLVAARVSPGTLFSVSNVPVYHGIMDEVPESWLRADIVEHLEGQRI